LREKIQKKYDKIEELRKIKNEQEMQRNWKYLDGQKSTPKQQPRLERNRSSSKEI